MSANVDFSNRDQGRRWLSKKPREVILMVAARAALRVAPLLVGALGPRGGSVARVILPAFRAMAVPWVACQYPTDSAGIHAATTASTAAKAINAGKASVVNATYAIYAAVAAARAVVGDAAIHAADAITFAADAADADATYADAKIIDHGASAPVLAERPLWLTEVPAWARDSWSNLELILLTENQDWQVWTTWYGTRLEGGRANEALEIARVMIADSIWREGPRAVNAEIARLTEQHEEREIFDYAFQEWDFFLSFTREDEAFARWIEKLLKAAGFSVFAEFTEMPVGSNFVREMQRGLAQSSRFIALLSPAYVKSDHCQAEWSAAFNTDAGGAARKLVPFLIRPTELPPLARQIVYKQLIGLSSADAATAILQAIEHNGTVKEIPSGWPGTVAVEQMQAVTGSIYEVAPGEELLLERQPPKINEAADAGFTPEQLYADFAREVEELAEHVNKGKGNVRCSDRLKDCVARLHQSIAKKFARCDVLAINKRLVWVLRTLANDQADGLIPRNDPLEHYASDLYGYYERLEFIFPKLKPFREMDARHRFTLPSKEEERAIREVYRIFGDPDFAKVALSRDLSEEMRQAGQSLEEAKAVASRKEAIEPSDVTIESHADAAARSLAVWVWLSNAREKFIKSGKSAKEFEEAIKGYEELYDRMSPEMIKYIDYLLKWFF